MKDVPIIFSAPMVVALLDGRKTMTRRLAWRNVGKPGDPGRASFHSPWTKVKPGDRLWVRENAWFDKDQIAGLPLRCFFEGGRVRLADGRDGSTPGSPDVATAEMFKLNSTLKLRPAIHMPRWASRLTLTVTATKIERLNDITEADAAAEGWKKRSDKYLPGEVHYDAARDWFSDLWEKLHGAEAWKQNPEVVALSFDVSGQNVDELARAA